MSLKVLVGCTGGARYFMSPYYAPNAHTNPRSPTQPLLKLLGADSPRSAPKTKSLQQDASWLGTSPALGAAPVAPSAGL